MNGFICKIFRFVLKVFKAVVDVVAQAIKTVGEAVVDVLGTLLDAAGGLLSKPFFWLLGGLGVYLLVTSKENEQEKAPANNPQTQQVGV